MPEQYIQLPPDSTGKKLRTRERDINSQTIQEQYVMIQSERVSSGIFSTKTFRTSGSAALPQNLFSLLNASGSTVLVAVRELELSVTYTAPLAGLELQCRVGRTTGSIPTGGTGLSKFQFDTQYGSNNQVFATGPVAHDGGPATPITMTIGTPHHWDNFIGRMHTVVGHVNSHIAIPLIPQICRSDAPIILRQNQWIGVQLNSNLTAANPNTNHYIVKCVWEEFTYP